MRTKTHLHSTDSCTLDQRETIYIVLIPTCTVVPIPAHQTNGTNKKTFTYLQEIKQHTKQQNVIAVK